jgi:hypothetical protein
MTLLQPRQQESSALQCGGYWDDAALSEAAAIFDDPATLLHHWAD